MPISPDEVEHVAQLARLELTDQEKRKFAGQLDAILTYMEKLNELDTSGVEPMLHGVEGRQPARPDSAGPSLPRDEALRNAPESQNGFFRVPPIID
ncbi:MAG: Asp-tRNA(Asn)/Glu-tRNA(Gln) amidotransferase subunit GatC [Planctomycetes bacterium]|nr:Asp-tRNA(Asn)/Glu-tRNA(Gln) amidotransferase subunit GatC [Planctomycetota bacterium]